MRPQKLCAACSVLLCRVCCTVYDKNSPCRVELEGQVVPAAVSVQRYLLRIKVL